jgi:hypothetical protein
MGPVKNFFHGVQGASADITVHHPDSPQHQGHQPVRRLVFMGLAAHVVLYVKIIDKAIVALMRINTVFINLWLC